ncbi:MULTISPECIES: alginate lyase family protein [Dickeya]|uniref:Probable exported protein YPO3473 n=1 Tax=Dickeya aquatica TaxID=1401087 RepID=A0A375A654_9GAMM|nr:MULTISPECIES: alginate lyase family protein [Dickeya]SLM61513.1 probable exported protein YPO3473 [Dickeya aquatica]
MRPGIVLLMSLSLWWSAAGLGATAPKNDNSAYVFLQHDALVEARQQLQQHRALPQTQQAYQALLHAADQALKSPLLSVTQKLSIPGSGDRHDYLSLAAYWWPDPQQKNGLPWVRRDGKVNPATKSEETDAVRMATFTQRARVLALAWYFSGKPAYADKAITMIRTWFINPQTRMNPNLNYAQAIPGHNQGHGRGAGVLDGRYFATRIVDTLLILRQAPGWHPDDEQSIRQWMTEYLSWLQNSPSGKQESAARNNHGTWYAVQVAGIAAYLGKTETVSAMIALVRQKLAHQLAADGSQPEELARTRSFHYSVFNLQAASLMAVLAARNSEDLWHAKTPRGSSLLSALDFMAPYLDAARPWPYKTMGRESGVLIPLLLQAERATGSPRYQAIILQAGFVHFLRGERESTTGISPDIRWSSWLLSRPVNVNDNAVAGK